MNMNANDARLWDVLWMARCAAARAMAGESEVEVKRKLYLFEPKHY
ncbi:MAG: hypothetical protein KA419_13930 [Acidobacteria bacterium]|nr:hypothetical protein [Acidobacteriota bacterium]